MKEVFVVGCNDCPLANHYENFCELDNSVVIPFWGEKTDKCPLLKEAVTVRLEDETD